MEAGNREKEIREAIAAADEALVCLNRADGHLRSAGNWGAVDLLGGGMLTTLIKHSKMNDAERDMQDAKMALQRFSKELSDVSQHVDFSFNTADFLSFADYFFDGLVADWLVQSRIHEAKDQVTNAIRQVTWIRSQLASELQR